MSLDKKSVKIVASTFFEQMQAAGYSSNQILEISSELIGLVTSDLKPAMAGDVEGDFGHELAQQVAVQ
jgi:hypothetical protein